MPKRIANHTIVLMRAGQRVTVKAKQMFDFTTAEMNEIVGINKDALRKPINEDDDVVELVIPSGGIVNPNEMTSNPDASVPAPVGQATAPVGKGGKLKTQTQAEKDEGKSADPDDL